MRKASRLIYILIGIAIFSTSFTKPDEVEITNGIIHASLYLPDADKGYYRASRFDWSGLITALDYNGHSYYGQWYKDYSPTINDAVMGPVEAFDPLGYNEAKAGGSFVKIGVGIIAKSDDLPYDFLRSYTILNSGKWSVKTDKNQVQFTHILNDKDYPYEYQKNVRLVKDKPVMVLTHILKNTGTRTIETAVFDHNFFVIDKQPTGVGFAVTFPFKLTGIANTKKDLVKLQDNQLLFLNNLDQKNVSFKDLTNGNGSDVYDLRVENRNTGAGVRITGDHPISKLVFWSASKTLCPEPYINIKVAPGQSFSWTLTYEYYTIPIVKQTTSDNTNEK